MSGSPYISAAFSGNYLGLDTSLGPNVLTLLSLEGEEKLSHCFLFTLTVVTSEPDGAVRSLLGQPVTAWLMNGDEDARRPIHGHVRRIASQGRDDHGNRFYRLELVPRLWFLNCTSDCRIYQNMALPDLLAEIFSEHGLTNFDLRLDKSLYKPAENRVQYRETAFAFVSRSMEHMGVFYWHEHSAGKHMLVVSDRNTAAPSCDPATVEVAQHYASYVADNLLRTFESDTTFRPGKWTLNDYDFEFPSKVLLADTQTVSSVPLMSAHEMYDYPGRFRLRDDGAKLSRLRMEMEEAQHNRVSGTGHCIGFHAGYAVTVKEDSRKPGTTYLLTEVRHRATSAGLVAGEGGGPSYSNEFAAIRADAPFRPLTVTPLPSIQGVQTATVTGPAGEQIHCDKYGRVKVLFNWDRRNTYNENSSCWVRVAQARSGAHYGTTIIPHVGHEVLVSFADGDPAKPVIVGTVPNGRNAHSTDLPAGKHKTLQRDHGDNQIVMNGKSGAEHLTMRSPRMINHFVGGPGARSLSAAATPVGAYVKETIENSMLGAEFLKGLGNLAATRIAEAGGVAAEYPTLSNGVVKFEVEPTARPVGSDSSVGFPASEAAGGKLTSISSVNKNLAVLNEVLAAWKHDAQGANDLPGSSLSGSHNSGAVGSINSVGLSDRNNWTAGTVNTWINLGSYSRVEGAVTNINGSTVNTTTVGAVKEDFKASYQKTVAGDSVKNVAGNSVATVAGDSKVVELGSSAKINASATAEIKMDASTSLHIGAAADLSIGVFFKASIGPEMKVAFVTMEEKINHIKTTATEVSQYVSQVSTISLYLAAHALHIIS